MYFFQNKIRKNNSHKTLEKAKTAILIVLALFMITSPVFANELSDINSQIDETTAKINSLRHNKRTLKEEIASFNNQIYLAQLEINQTQSEINETNRQIAHTENRILQAEKELQYQKELMKEFIRTMYIQGQTSTIELIAKSNSFSEFVDKRQYLDTMQQHVEETANKITELMNELETKKQELGAKKEKALQLKSAQLQRQAAIINQKAIKDNLLAQTQGSESRFQSILNGLYAERAALSASNNETVSGGSSGYPYSKADPDGIDPWNFWYRQCTSYAAWRSSVNGPVSATMLAHWGSGHVANGGDWGSLASSHGYKVSTTPKAYTIMSFPYQRGLPYGHVAYVESVNADGTVNISEYNWSIRLGFSQRYNVNPANYNAVFISR